MNPQNLSYLLEEHPKILIYQIISVYSIEYINTFIHYIFLKYEYVYKKNIVTWYKNHPI